MEDKIIKTKLMKESVCIEFSYLVSRIRDLAAKTLYRAYCSITIQPQTNKTYA